MVMLYWFLAFVGLIGSVGAVLVGLAMSSAVRQYKHATRWNRAQALIELAAKRQRALWVAATKAGRANERLTDNDLSKLLRDIKAGAVTMAREEGLDIVAAVGGEHSFEGFAWEQAVRIS